MRTILGFLLGASAVALVTTERGRRFASDITDEIEGMAKERIREIKEELAKPEEVRQPEHKEEGHA